jgi:hypothetical protein
MQSRPTKASCKANRSAQKCRAREKKTGSLLGVAVSNKYLLAAMCSHHLEKGDGADEVVVIVQQGLLDALANSFEPSKVNHSLKPASTSGVLCISQKQRNLNLVKTISSGPTLNKKIRITECCAELCCESMDRKE